MPKVIDLQRLSQFKDLIDGEIPTKTSDLTNDSSFQTQSQVNAAIASAISGVSSFSYEIVNELPASGEAGKIYLVPNDGLFSNIYDEYIWISSSNRYEMFGTTEIDTSDFLKTEDVGDLAYKDSASGSYTPAGTVSQPTTTLTAGTTTVKSMKTTGSVPSWSVSGETATFSAGSAPTSEDVSVVNGISNIVTTQPTFSGTATTISVS